MSRKLRTTLGFLSVRLILPMQLINQFMKLNRSKGSWHLTSPCIKDILAMLEHFSGEINQAWNYESSQQNVFVLWSQSHINIYRTASAVGVICHFFYVPKSLWNAHQTDLSIRPSIQTNLWASQVPHCVVARVGQQSCLGLEELALKFGSRIKMIAKKLLLGSEICWADGLTSDVPSACSGLASRCSDCKSSRRLVSTYLYSRVSLEVKWLWLPYLFRYVAQLAGRHAGLNQPTRPTTGQVTNI